MNEDIREIGILNRKLYACITSRIDTDRIIVTDKQLEHMAEKHPEAYAETLIELRSVISEPDYIFKDDKHEDTGLVIKAIPTGNRYFYIVLKICTNSMGGERANSIISGWKISERRLKNYLRNKELLYKRS